MQPDVFALNFIPFKCSEQECSVIPHPIMALRPVINSVVLVHVSRRCCYGSGLTGIYAANPYQEISCT